MKSFFSRNRMSFNTFERECVEEHNKYRALHGAPPLELNKNLCNYANEWAQNLARKNTMQHRSNNNYGENIFMTSSSTVNGQQVVQAWYDEYKNYNYGSATFGSNTGHFTQVVWSSSKQLGVGIANNGNYTYVVANYDPQGNFMGRFSENVLPRKG